MKPLHSILIIFLLLITANNGMGTIGAEFLVQAIANYNRGDKEKAKVLFMKACKEDDQNGCTFAMEFVDPKEWAKTLGSNPSYPSYDDLWGKCLAQKNPNCLFVDIFVRYMNTRSALGAEGQPILTENGAQRLLPIVKEMADLDLHRLLLSKLSFMCLALDVELNKGILIRAAERLFEEAAKRGEKGAFFQYAFLIKDSNPSEAHMWFEKSSFSGDDRSSLATTADYLGGIGVATNRLYGLAWLSICSSRGNEVCKKAFREAEKAHYYGVSQSKVENLAHKFEKLIQKKKEHVSSLDKDQITCKGDFCDFKYKTP